MRIREWRSDVCSSNLDNSRQVAMPAALVLPNETAQVRERVRACRRHGMPIIARGRGTNTTGATVPINGGVVVSFERMNRLLRMAPEDRLALVEPGLRNGDLQLAAKPHALDRKSTRLNSSH